MEKTIRVITLYQPWATLLAYGIKLNETRPSPTPHTFEKGQYLIHAAKKWNSQLNDLCLKEPFYSELKKIYPYPPISNIELKGDYASVSNYEKGEVEIMFPLGQIIGSFEVEECFKVIGTYVNLAKSDSNFYTELSNKDMFNLENHKVSYIRNDSNELRFGDYSIGRSIWIGQNHKILENPIPYKGSQGYYAEFKGDINQLKFK